MQFFTSTDCSTGPIRSEAANPTATNPVARVSGWDFYHGEPHTECLDIGGGHSLYGNYVDMSAGRLIGTLYHTSDCSGTGYPYTDVTDGQTCNAAASPPGTATICVLGTCTVYRSSKVLCESYPPSTATLEFRYWDGSVIPGTCAGNHDRTSGRMVNYPSEPHTRCMVIPGGGGTVRGDYCDGFVERGTYFASTDDCTVHAVDPSATYSLANDQCAEGGSASYKSFCEVVSLPTPPSAPPPLDAGGGAAVFIIVGVVVALLFAGVAVGVLVYIKKSKDGGARARAMLMQALMSVANAFKCLKKRRRSPTAGHVATTGTGVNAASGQSTGQARAEMLESQPYDQSRGPIPGPILYYESGQPILQGAAGAVANPTGEQQAQRPYPTGELALRMLQEELKKPDFEVNAAAIKIFSAAGALLAATPELVRGSSAEQQRALAEEFAADDEMYNKLVAEMSEKDKALFAKLRATLHTAAAPPPAPPPEPAPPPAPPPEPAPEPELEPQLELPESFVLREEPVEQTAPAPPPPPPPPASQPLPPPRFCTSCGAALQPGALFCSSCGAKVPALVPVPAAGESAYVA